MRERRARFKGTTVSADTEDVATVAADIAVEALVAPFSILFVLAILGAPSAWLAKRRGRSMVIWGGVGMVLPIFGILLLFVMGDTEEARAP